MTLNAPNKLTAVFSILALSLLSACTAGHVKPEDRDTTGTYDGVWIGAVGGPRASQEVLAGKWFMTCDWEPFDIYLTVDDGRVQLGKLEGKTPVSQSGYFRIDVSSGPAGMQSGVMPGNSKFVQTYSGKLTDVDATGKYAQFIPSHGTNGCNAPIQFRRYSESGA